MRRLFYLLILLMLVFACGEKAPKKPEPPKDGPFYVGDSLNYIKYLYKNGAVVSETPFVDGKANGKSTDYFSNGKVRLTVEYRDAKRNGIATMYYETGEKYADIPYVDGKIHGVKYRYMKNGSVTMKSEFVNGNPIPPFEEYDAGGKAIAQPTIKFKNLNGKLNIELSDKNFKVSKFYVVDNETLKEIPTNNGVGVLYGAKKGTRIRAIYSSPRTQNDVDGAIDAKY